jgi:hypothetical protein
MSDLLKNIAAQAGIETSQAENGLGALLSTVKEHAPAGDFDEIKNALPGADGALEKFNAISEDGSSSMISGLSGLASGALGGKSEQLTTLISKFSTAGFSANSLKSFLPALASGLTNSDSGGVMEKISSSIPGLSGMMGGEKSGLMGKVSKLFG